MATTRMRKSMVTLVASLAIIVFLTSLIIETKEQCLAKGSLEPGRGANGVIESTETDRSSVTGAGPPAPGGTRVPELMLRAEQFYLVGNLPGAADLLHGVLQRDPANTEALNSLGIIYFKLNQYRNAAEYLGRLLPLTPDDDVARARLGVSQLRCGNYAEALKNLQIVLNQEPDDGALHFSVACAHAALGSRKPALEHLQLSANTLGVVLLSHISDPHLDLLRNEPQFQEIVRELVARYRLEVAQVPSAGDDSGQ